MEKPVAGIAYVFNVLILMGNAFSESEDTGVFKDNKKKLFASNERHIDNHTLMLKHASLKHVSCVYLP